MAKSAHPIDWVKGAGDGMLAAARMVYIFGRNADDADERVLVRAKSNMGEEGSMTFAFDIVETNVEGETRRWPAAADRSDVGGQAEEDRRRRAGQGRQGPQDDTTKRAVAVEWLTSLLMFGEMHAKDIEAKAEDAGISSRTLRRAEEELGASSGSSTGGSARAATTGGRSLRGTRPRRWARRRGRPRKGDETSTGRAR